MLTYIEQKQGLMVIDDGHVLGTIKKVSGGYAFYPKWRPCCGGKTYRTPEDVKTFLENNC